MANYNDNDLDELDFGQEGQTPAQPEPEKKPSNRNFIIALGVIGAVFILLTIALIAVALFILPGQNKARQAASLQTLTANTATSKLATEQAVNSLIVVPTAGNTPTPESTATTPAQPTNTPVLAPTQTNTSPASVITETATPVSDAQKATLSAQQTQLAGGKFTATVIATSTALPNTGFADEVGLPALLGLGLAMILVIFLVRRLRASAVH